MLKLIKRLRRNDILMALACSVLVLGQIYFDLKLPDYMSNLTVLIETPGSTMGDILNTGLEMLGCTLASAALCIICGYLTAKVAAGFALTTREAVFNKIADFGQYEMMHFSVPSLINRTTNDITQVQMVIAMGLQLLIKSPIMAAWAIIKIIDKSWELSAITAGFIVSLLMVIIVIIVLVLPRFRRVQKLTDHINLVARENLTGINVVHAYNAEDYQNAKFEKSNSALMRTQLFNQRTFAFLMPVVTLGMNTLALVIYWVGAAIVNAVPAEDMAGRLESFSNIVVFGTYATYVIMSILMLVIIIMLLPAAQVSAGRINEVLSAESSILEGGVTESPETGTVEFKDVSFHYPDGGDVLEHISFKANKGETVAFIGATGSGKTTLVSLLMRFYEINSGSIKIDGAATSDMKREAVHNLFSMVLQDTWLFEGTVRDNLVYNKQGVTDEQLENACRACGIYHFIETLPKGFDTVLDDSIAISAGQKQLLTIARAMIQDNPMLILDEATSSVDTRTELVTQRAMDELTSHRTSFVIAHRLSTIKNADLILVLRDGDIVEQGTHEELLSKGGFYAELYMSQFEKSA